MKAFKVLTFLYLLIALTFVEAYYSSESETSTNNEDLIIDKLNEMHEKMDAMDDRLEDMSNAEYRNSRQWMALSEKEYEMQQSLENIKEKIEELSKARANMEKEAIGMSRNFKNLIESQRETSFIVTDLHDSQKKINSNLEGYISSGNQKIIENLKNKSDEVVKLLSVVQKDQGRLTQQCTISDEQCSKTFISKLEGHSGSLNKILQEKHKNLLENQIEIMKDFKNNTEKIDGLSDLIQKSIPNSVELASQTTNMKNILTAEQLRSELHDLNKTIIDLGKSTDTMIKFSLFNTSFDSCSSALKIASKSGVYKLNIPNSGLEPFNAYCMLDKDGEDGWTVIQRRFDGSVDFNRSWTDYKNGFGNLSGEYWLGLEKIHALTSSTPHMLWVEIGDLPGNKFYTKYSHFEIGSESEDYFLKSLGNYSGDAGNGMPVPSSKFSTYDVDNEYEKDYNCAVRWSGGWWFDNCDFCILNGEYRKGHGMSMNRWQRFKYLLKSTFMAIRAVN